MRAQPARQFYRRAHTSVIAAVGRQAPSFPRRRLKHYPTPARGSSTSYLPWAVAAIALLALLALSAGKFFNTSRSSLDAPQNALPQAALGEEGSLTNESSPSAMSGGRAPDNSSMSPEERADHLFNRVSEVAKKLPEYSRHQDDIVNALVNARRSFGIKG